MFCLFLHFFDSLNGMAQRQRRDGGTQLILVPLLVNHRRRERQSRCPTEDSVRPVFAFALQSAFYTSPQLFLDSL
jgi:hypothetical protein